MTCQSLAGLTPVGVCLARISTLGGENFEKNKSEIILALALHLVDFLKMVAAAAAFAGLFETGTASNLFGSLVLLAMALVIAYICKWME